MKNERFIVITLLTLFSVLPGRAQTIFRDGFVIKNNGDTLNGLVQYNGNNKTPKKCIFKRFDIANTVQYLPSDILSFGYKSGNCYIVKEIGHTKAFVECMVRGKISVYLSHKELLVEKSGYQITPLTKGRITTLKDGNRIEFADFKQYLTDLTGDKPGFNIPDDLTLNESKIIEVVSEYNQESDKKNVVFNREPATDLFSEATMMTGANMSSFGITGGYCSYKYHFKRKDPIIYIPSKKPSDNSFSVSAFYNRNLSRLSDKYSIRLELAYSQNSYYYYEEISKSKMDILFHYHTIKIPLLFQYAQKFKKFKAYINGGVAVNYIFNKDYNRIEEKESSGNTIYTYEYKDFNFRKIEFSLIVSAGVQYKISGKSYLFMEPRFDYGSGVFVTHNTNNLGETQANGFSQSISQINFAIGIGF